MKQNNTYIGLGVLVVIVGVMAFFGGMQYEKKQVAAVALARNSQFGGRMMGNGQGFDPRNGNEPGQGPGQGSGPRPAGGMMGFRPVVGEIISQDGTGMTIKMPDGSTKIVIVTDQTPVQKATQGARSDLQVGDQVNIFGTENKDGSVTAQSISIGDLMRRGLLDGQANQVTTSPTPAVSP